VKVPFDGAYWADPGRLLAGPYPGEYDAALTRRNMSALLRAGIRTIVSLMQAREERPDGDGQAAYVPVLETVAARLGIECEWRRYEIHDMSIPDIARMDEIQAAIDESLARGRPVYAHCWAGRGRTGTVVGAYLIRKGLATHDDFVDVISGLRQVDDRPAPETEEQIAFVRAYAALHAQKTQ
jgi:hypothetical protein